VDLVGEKRRDGQKIKEGRGSRVRNQRGREDHQEKEVKLGHRGKEVKSHQEKEANDHQGKPVIVAVIVED
jgi:hypothetical protein